jgi:hypothetical protein
VCFSFIQVKLFPGTKKFETETKPESWPVYNQDFSFEIANISVAKKDKPLSEILSASHFLVFTIYAEDAKKKKLVIGAATWPLDHTLFTHKLHTLDFGDNEELETSDIWRKTEEISSGIAGVKQKVSNVSILFHHHNVKKYRTFTHTHTHTHNLMLKCCHVIE